MNFIVDLGLLIIIKGHTVLILSFRTLYIFGHPKLLKIIIFKMILYFRTANFFSKYWDIEKNWEDFRFIEDNICILLLNKDKNWLLFVCFTSCFVISNNQNCIKLDRWISIPTIPEGIVYCEKKMPLLDWDWYLKTTWKKNIFLPLFVYWKIQPFNVSQLNSGPNLNLHQQ